jgi:mono/diheme cytochrome c family protein
MKKSIVLAITLILVGSLLIVSSVAAQAESVSRGGRLYDKWWAETGAEKPTIDQALWAMQSTNTRSGADTWRCKECHGWDYLGEDGAYGSGSHFTGFPGVYEAAQTSTVEELAAALKGATNPDHDFSSILDDAAMNDLVTFLKNGLLDVRQHVDYSTKAPVSANQANGAQLFANTCTSCHGADGTAVNFGDDDEPEYVGTIAVGNPQEFVHKARFGQPGSNPAMPATIDLDWSVQDAVDVLAYAQTLPTGEEPALLPEAGYGPPAGTFPPLLVIGLAALAMGLGLLAWERVVRVRRRV